MPPHCEKAAAHIMWVGLQTGEQLLRWYKSQPGGQWPPRRSRERKVEEDTMRNIHFSILNFTLQSEVHPIFWRGQDDKLLFFSFYGFI